MIAIMTAIGMLGVAAVAIPSVPHVMAQGANNQGQNNTNQGNRAPPMVHCPV